MAGDGGGGGGTNRSLQETPSWALATVCFIFIFLGIFIEHLIHLVSHWLKKKKKSALYEAMEKLKTVLMQLGFMSLILTAIQRWIPKICIKLSVANSMLPCRRHAQIKINSADSCASKGMASLMSQGGINQLNIFIFVLAVMQIVYSLATMGLGRAKMKSWKTWEKETQTVEYMVANDPERFRYTRQTTFWRRHVMTDCTTHRAILWIQCFFRQFFHSVAKVDYFTLRHGFISAHLSTNITFNFRKYIQRSLEDDFKGVIGISPIMWFLVIIFLLVDVHGWNVYLWVSFLPLLIVILVGTKLQVIVARMAMQLANQNTVIKGTPLVQLSNTLFWFNRPQLVLTLLHFTLFMNAFEFSFFIWVTWQFGIHSCYHEHVEIIVTRVVLAVMVQVLCSYITLPLYALVTQMGSQYKSAILEEHTIHAIKQWHANVKHKRKKNHLQQQSPAAGVQDDSWSSGMNSPSPDISTHRRASTFTEFDSRRGGDDREIVEDIEIELQRDHPGNQIQEIRQNEHEFNQRV